MSSEPPSSEKTKFQKEWDQKVVDRQFNHLIMSSQESDKARLLSCAGKPSGKWLNCLPSANLGLLLDNDTYRLAMGLYVGAKICEKHTCKHCGYTIEENGQHILHCKGSNQSTINRHNMVNSCIISACKRSNLGAIIEPNHLCNSSSTRPDGMTMQPYSKGKNLVWDVTIIDPTAPSYCIEASEKQGSAAEIAFKRKLVKYSHLETMYHFTPLAIETFGNISPKSLTVLKTLSKLEKSATNTSVGHLLQNISICLMRGNAQILLNYFSSMNLD